LHIKQEDIDESVRARPEINANAMELIKRLRKKDYDFASIDRVVKTLSRFTKDKPVGNYVGRNEIKCLFAVELH
jgi:hypothetical protein